jgi:hypothetical protein
MRITSWLRSTALAIRRVRRKTARAERTTSFESSELVSLRFAVRTFSYAASTLILVLLVADVADLAPGLSAAGVSSAMVAATLFAIGLVSRTLPRSGSQMAFFVSATLAVVAIALLQLEEQPNPVFGFHLEAMAPVAVAAFARWSLRWHFSWLAAILAGLVAVQVARSLAGLEPDTFGQLMASFSVGAIVSMAVLLTLRLERYRSFVLLRRIAGVSRRAQSAQGALSESLEQLRQSQLTLRKLEGILPVCASCGLVRTDDDSEWLPLADYLVRRGAVSMSHGLCPDCYERAVKVGFGSA